MSEEKLTAFLKTGKDWARLRTSVEGVFVLKLPAYRRSPTCLAVELNPIDEGGKPKKRRGLILRSNTDLEEYKSLFRYDKLSKLLAILDAVNPKPSVARRRKEEEVLEL